MLDVLIGPWNSHVLLPPSSDHDGNVETQDERQGNQIREGITVPSQTFEHSKLIKRN